MAGAVDVPTQRITTTWPSPWTFVTAFDEDITMGTTDLDASPAFLVWPTVSDDVVHVRSNGADRLSRITVVDATGRTARSFAPGSTDGTFTLSVADLGPGIYMLWLNDTQAFRIVRP